MLDWNVVVSTRERGFAAACGFLGKFGPVQKTPFFNVLIMRVENVREFLEGLHQKISENPGALNFLARVSPVSHTFEFHTPEEFEGRAGEAALRWAREIAGKRFHVRIRRRGFKGRLSSMEEERVLADLILEALNKAGGQGHVSFKDPDAVLAVEIVGQRAGLSLWTREEMARYPLLRVE